MKPVVDGLEKQYEGKVEFRRVNTDKATAEEEALMQQNGIRSIPSFVFLNSDGSRADLLVGEVAEAKMKAVLDALK